MLDPDKIRQLRKLPDTFIDVRGYMALKKAKEVALDWYEIHSKKYNALRTAAQPEIVSLATKAPEIFAIPDNSELKAIAPKFAKFAMLHRELNTKAEIAVSGYKAVLDAKSHPTARKSDALADMLEKEDQHDLLRSAVTDAVLDGLLARAVNTSRRKPQSVSI
jgi:hypothetical protein